MRRFDYDGPSSGGGGGGGVGQIIEAGRPGSRTVGDFLRVAGNTPLTAVRGVAVFASGTISRVYWIGAVGGGTPGDPIGLEISVIRAGSTVSSTVVDCTSASFATPFVLPATLAVLAGDSITASLANASAGTATGASNIIVAMEVVPS